MLAFIGKTFEALGFEQDYVWMLSMASTNPYKIWPPFLSLLNLPEHFIARFYDVKPSFHDGPSRHLKLIAMSLLGLRSGFGLRLTPILICSDLYPRILGRSVNWHHWLMLWADSQQIPQYLFGFNVDLFNLLPCWYVPPQLRIFPLACCLEFWASVTILLPPQQRILYQIASCAMRFLAHLMQLKACLSQL